MAIDDGMREPYGVAGISGVRKGTVFPRTNVKKRPKKDKEEQAESESERPQEDREGIDIRV